MTYMKFPRVGILKGQEIIEYGYLNQSMPQIHDNGSYVYEISGDSGTEYLLSESEFVYIKWE